MKARYSHCLLLLFLFLGNHANAASPTEVLDELHRAGEAADSAAFLSVLTGEAVVLGMDNGQLLQGESLRSYVNNRFAEDRSWKYRASQRHISYSDHGAVAWFNEALEHPDGGSAWGTGVLVRSDTSWKIAQYSVTPAVPASSGTVAVPEAAPDEPVTDTASPGKGEKKRHCRRLRHKTNKVSSC